MRHWRLEFDPRAALVQGNKRWDMLNWGNSRWGNDDESNSFLPDSPFARFCRFVTYPYVYSCRNRSIRNTSIYNCVYLTDTWFWCTELLKPAFTFIVLSAGRRGLGSFEVIDVAGELRERPSASRQGRTSRSPARH
jgi:hypothetical protein